MTEEKNEGIPQAFIWRRMHSLLGLFLVLFVMEHLLTNSQAALLIGNDGAGFIKAVNWIHGLPFLPAIEIALLGIPILMHTIWGIRALRTAQPNSLPGDGSKVSLPNYSRNHAYTWQRITSWALIIAIGWHVWEMRFDHQPAHARVAQEHKYVMKVSLDDGLYTVANRLNVSLMNKEMIQKEERRVALDLLREGSSDTLRLIAATDAPLYDQERELEMIKQERQEQEHKWLEALKHKELSDGELMAVAPDFGTAILLMVRDTMKDPITCVLYSFLVIFGVYHAFNGLWTFTVTWGIALTERSQRVVARATQGLMALFMFLGLSAVWLTYFVNLRY